MVKGVRFILFGLPADFVSTYSTIFLAPVFSDYHNEGYNYRLVAYRNLVTKEQYSLENIQKEIKAENRIGTLEAMKEEIEEIQEQTKTLECNRKLDRNK